MTFTKERLTELSRRENVGAILGEEIAELARIALALLEAEAVGEVVLGEYDDCGCHPDAKVVCIAADGQADWENFKDGTRLYTAHPAPVSVPAAMEIDDDFDSAFEHGKAVGWNAYRAAMLQSGNFRENKNSSTNNFREIAETSTNYPVIPSEVLSAILKVAKIRADFDDFDGDRRGIGDCLDEAEQELIVTINKYASQLAAEPIATNDVREQTAVPPVPVIQADVAQAIEKLKRKLVECNRYNYCADAVKGVEYACHAAMLQGSQPVSQTYKFPVNTPCQDAPAHIWLQTAGVWPEDGELSELTWCSHNQHHDDTLYVRADLVNGNSPVIPDGWISCSERMPDKLIPVMVMYEDGEMWSAMWNGNRWDDGTEYPDPHSVTHWREMPAAPQQEVK
ncbi:DUF551 domain-containing protein [Escherichia coli]|jgi:hypothetical protein|nr:hypothetical protein C1I23_19255 [Escherichia coli]EFI6181027.1 DUF551 domain-containing protein [Escherichia coli]EFK3434436.1 DUF551 domain-containing protein [Escherichia coli]EGD8973233.1 DUF551 domain-containing protein [Escherichia coli]EGD9482387.1 DUF551 domain-containing protein [Escherichia coli]